MESPAEVLMGGVTVHVAVWAVRDRTDTRRASPRGNGDVDIGAEETSASSGNVADIAVRAAFLAGGTWCGVQ